MSARKDAVSLYVVQACSYILPLMVLPFLSRTLGPEKFGEVSFAQAFMQFFVMLTDFGFDLTAARQVSIHRNDPKMVARLYWTVTTAKSCLALSCGLLIALLITFVPALHQDRYVISIGFLWLCSTVLNPLWLYQGLGKMPQMALVSLLSRVVCLIPLFPLVASPSDYLIAAACLSCPAVISGIYLTTMAYWTGMISSWQRVPREEIWQQSVEAFQIFSGSALTFVYTYANAVILKFIAGNEAVGYFVTAEKLVNPLKQLFSPLIQAIYPRLCILYAEDKATQAAMIVRRVVLTVVLVNACAILVVYLGADRLILIIFGDKFIPALPVLKILIFLPITIGLATVFMQLRLVAQGEFRSLKRIYGVGAAFHIVQSVWLVTKFGAMGTAISVLLTEILVTVLIYHECREVRNRRRFA